MSLFRCKRRPQVDLEVRSPQLGIKYKDLLVLEQLAKVGADMAKPRHILYYLYFAGPDNARAAAAEAGSRGFQTDLRDPSAQAPEEWTLVCELVDTVLELEMVRDNTDLFEDLASRHAGTYDGWEASAD